MIARLKAWSARQPHLFGKPWPEQAFDQILHAIWGGLTSAALTYGTLDLSTWLHRIAFGVGCVSALAIIVRGILQLPPNKARPFDPLLDGAGFMAGASAGILTVLGVLT